VAGVHHRDDGDEQPLREGLLTRSMVGRAWVYEPTLTRGKYAGQVMRDALLSTKDRTSALAHFVEAMTLASQPILST
jgi:predicted transcriptional regulator